MLKTSTVIFFFQMYFIILNFIVLNGMNITQTFYFIGGFIAAYLFPSRTKHQNSNVKLFIEAFILRYLRYAPLQGIAILLHSTWLSRFGSGPIYNKIIYAEQQFCRQHWWKNMLFIANYSKVPEMCLLHTWYMSTDFWVSAAGILFLIAIKK